MADDQPLTDLERLLPPHLGGHFGNSNIDTQTLDYLTVRFRKSSFLDVGCGPGGMVQAAEARGYDAWGVDGDPHMERPNVIIHDYTMGPLVPPRAFGLIWCMEFVEHVEAAYQDNYLATFAVGDVLFLTAAPPGFPGWHHVNCIIEGTPVQASGIRAATRRAYHGDIVTIVTARGHKITVTPNHPILTDSGWVAAERICKGDNVISSALTHGVVVDRMPNDKDRPILIEQVFRSFVEMPNAVRIRMPGTAKDFHGDGRQGDVDIVWANRTLKTERNTTIAQPAADSALQMRDAQLLPLVRDGALTRRGELISIGTESQAERVPLRVGELGGAAAHRFGPRHDNPGIGQRATDNPFINIVGVGDIPDGHAFLVQPGNIRDWQDLTVCAFRFGTDGDATIDKDAPRVSVVDVRELSEGGETFAGLVATDEVISVECADYTGHVYNLHTDSNWYFANSIITHNCQPQGYWISLLEQHGWRLDVEATQWVRQNGGHPFSTRQGLVFVTS